MSALEYCVVKENGKILVWTLAADEHDAIENWRNCFVNLDKSFSEEKEKGTVIIAKVKIEEVEQ